MLGLALVALLAFGALSAAAASAGTPYWQVGGAPLGAGVSKAFTATSTTEVVLSGGGVILKAPAGECSQSGEIEGVSGGPGKKKNVFLTCKKLKVFADNGTELPQCSAKTTGTEAGTITTNSLKGTLVWLNLTGGAAGDLLEPTSGTEWMKIEVGVGQPTCPIKGNYPVTNVAINEIWPAEEVAVTGALKLPKSPILSYWNNEAVRVKQAIGGLKIKTIVSSLTGQFSFSLNSKEAFGVSPAPVPGKPALRWKIGDYFLPAGATTSFTAVTLGSVTWEDVGFTVKLPKCTESGKFVGSTPGQPGGKKEVVLTCTGANIPARPECTVRSLGQPAGTVVSSNLQSTLVSLTEVGNETAHVGEVWSSESGGVWFYVEILRCGLAQSYGINGELIRWVEPVEASFSDSIGTLPSSTVKNYWAYDGSPHTVTGLTRIGGGPIGFSGILETKLVSGDIFGVFRK